MKRQDFFTQLGEATSKIAYKLSQNQTIIRLLQDMSTDPLAESKIDIDLSDPDFEKGLIRTIPKVDYTEKKEGHITLLPLNGTIGISQSTANVMFNCDIYLPLEKWKINNPIQRPYLLMSEIYQLLNNQRVTGIGTLRFVDFEFDIIDNDLSLHIMKFVVDTIG